MAKGQGTLQLHRLADMAEHGVEFQPTALIIRSEITYRQFERLGGLLGNISDASKWWIGDWLLFGDEVYGEKMAQAMEATGRAYHTLQNYRWVASKIAQPRRRGMLSHSTHAEVAPLPPEEQADWLDRCEANSWNTHELRQAIKDAGQNGNEPRSEPTWTVEPDPEQVISLASRLIHECQPTGTGDYLISGEIVAQLRACFGAPE